MLLYTGFEAVIKKNYILCFLFNNLVNLDKINSIMKKNVLILQLVLFSLFSYSQIVFENKYNSEDVEFKMLENYGIKYYFVDEVNHEINFYNLDHSLFKSISIVTDSTEGYNISFVSESLFDTDNRFEYIKTTWVSSQLFYMKIYNEDQELLLSIDSVALFSSASSLGGIVNTSEGTKMILRHYDESSRVYGLPGHLACYDCDDIIINNVEIQSSNKASLSNPFPNPSIDYVRINYQLLENEKQGELILYDINGIELKRYQVDKTFDHLIISIQDLPVGTYFYNLHTSQGISGGKKMIVIK